MAEEPVLEGNNGNGGKKLPINVSLKLKSGILLSALCAFHFNKLEVDLRPGWDNGGFLRLGLREEGRRLCFRSNPQICCFVAKSRQRALAC